MSDKQNKRFAQATNTRSREIPKQQSVRSVAMLAKDSVGRGVPSTPSLVRMPRLEHERKSDNFIEKMVVVISIIFAILMFPLSLLCILMVSRQNTAISSAIPHAMPPEYGEKWGAKCLNTRHPRKEGKNILKTYNRFYFQVVRQFERAIILRNGKLYKKSAFGPGLIFYLPCVDSVKFIDLRTFVYVVPPQEALTKDSLTVSVDAVVFYKIVDPVQAVISVTDYKSSTHYLAATTLRNAIGTRKLAEVLGSRPEVSHQVFELMKNITQEWGIQIVRVEIKDISLPLQLQKAMAAEAESTRLANAKIIVAKAEIESTKNLQLATVILMDNPMCMQLRYLQSLQMIAGDNTHTIVFPFSADIFKKIFGR